MSELKKYKVTATSTTQYEVEVMARDKDEAIEKAENIDGGEWKEESVWCADWDITGAEEIKKEVNK